MEEIICTKESNGLGIITLNRPKALNALSYHMLKNINETLREWRHDDQIQLILLDATGDRAFCAGGDIKALYEMKQANEKMDDASLFFELEYKTDEMIYHYPKPIVANLDGIVMGGGVGLSYGADVKIVTDRTKWAMPEMNISFFPDVGAAYFLNKAPGMMGRFVGLTAKTLGAADVLYMNAANLYVEHEQLPRLIEELKTINWLEENATATLLSQMKKYAASPEQKGELQDIQEKVDLHFKYDTIEEMVDSLDKDPSKFAQETKEALLRTSPISLKVTLEQLKRGVDKSFRECLQMDLFIATNFMKYDDFFEGVRSVLIDKDRSPNYHYKHLSDVTEKMVDSFFE